jgi:transposase-like protein
MKRRKWKPEQKALIVLEGLKGRPIGDLCAEHEISQAQYYQWRDQFLANAAKAFEPAGAPQRQGRLERENARLKNLVGELAPSTARHDHEEFGKAHLRDAAWCAADDQQHSLARYAQVAHGVLAHPRQHQKFA